MADKSETMTANHFMANTKGSTTHTMTWDIIIITTTQTSDKEHHKTPDRNPAPEKGE